MTNLEGRLLIVACVVHSFDMKEAKVIVILDQCVGNLLRLDMKLRPVITCNSLDSFVSHLKYEQQKQAKLIVIFNECMGNPFRLEMTSRPVIRCHMLGLITIKLSTDAKHNKVTKTHYKCSSNLLRKGMSWYP